MNAFKKWFSTATTPEKRRLARLAGTTEGTLRQVAGAYKTDGDVRASPALARRIEIGSIKMGLRFNRETLSPVCRKCELAQRCRG